MIAQDESGELVDRQIRPLSRSEHREESQPRHRQFVQVMKRVANKLAGFLCRCVRTYRVIDGISLAERNLLIVSVNT